MPLNFRDYSTFKKYLLIWTAIITIVTLSAISISVVNIYLLIPLGIIISYLIHPIYILFLIVFFNPFADWIVVKYPSLFTKTFIDLLIFFFTSSILLRNLIKQKKWVASPFIKWLLPIFTLFIISVLFHRNKFEDILFSNWAHFRFIYLAIGLAQLRISDTQYTGLLKGIFIILFAQVCIGFFQVLGGEWAKDLFYQNSERIFLSYGPLQYSSYETALSFNLPGITYIYSTFYVPGLFGSFLLVMLCLAIGMRIAISRIPAYRNQLSSSPANIPFHSIFANRKIYFLLFSLITILFCLTFNRTTYISFIILLSFLIIWSANKKGKLLIYAVTLLSCSIIIYSFDNLFDYLMRVSNPDIGEFDPISRLFSFYASYLGQDTPRKIAYFAILPKILCENTFMGLGVASMLTPQNFFPESPLLSDALSYAYVDAGIVRLFIDYGLLGAAFWGILFINIFRHARKRFMVSEDSKDAAICFSVMAGLITLIPVSVGTSLILSKSYGLYLWMLIGLSQKRN